MTCKKCHGTGFIWYEDDPSPAGVSLSPGTMTFIDPCPDCMEKGVCPKCGGALGEADDDGNCKCTVCDYDSKVAEDAGPIYDEIDDPYHGEDMPDYEPVVSAAEVEAAVNALLGREVASDLAAEREARSDEEALAEDIAFFRRYCP